MNEAVRRYGSHGKGHTILVAKHEHIKAGCSRAISFQSQHLPCRADSWVQKHIREARYVSRLLKSTFRPDQRYGMEKYKPELVLTGS